MDSNTRKKRGRVSDARLAQMRAWMESGNMLEGLPGVLDDTIDDLALDLIDYRAALAKVTLERDALRAALRSAPMPSIESVLTSDEWEERYDDWWHSNASEAALSQRTETADSGRNEVKP